MPNYVDTMVLGNGHSILMSHVPNHHEEISNRDVTRTSSIHDNYWIYSHISILCLIMAKKGFSL